MKARIEKGGLQLRKRLRRGLAPRIVSAKIEEDNLSILCRYYYDDPDIRLDAYVLDENWMRIPSDMEQLQRQNLFKITIPSCRPGIYKVEGVEQGFGSKLSYDSVRVE